MKKKKHDEMIEGQCILDEHLFKYNHNGVKCSITPKSNFYVLEIHIDYGRLNQEAEWDRRTSVSNSLFLSVCKTFSKYEGAVEYLMTFFDDMASLINEQLPSCIEIRDKMSMLFLKGGYDSQKEQLKEYLDNDDGLDIILNFDYEDTKEDIEKQKEIEDKMNSKTKFSIYKMTERKDNPAKVPDSVKIMNALS